MVSRRAALAALGALGAGGAAAWMLRTPAPVDEALRTLEQLPDTDPMPAVFVGHGTPLGALAPNVWNTQWGEIGATLPRPRAILSISAHWLTEAASLVTAAAAPPMNYDVRGFPAELYQFRYDAPGDPAVAREVVSALDGGNTAYGDSTWGFDHGTWLVLKYMYPRADIPVLQLSIDYTRPPAFHYDLATRLRRLRSKGILVLGSGNFVHNLYERGGTGVTETPRDWAVEFDQRMFAAVSNGDHEQVVNFQSLGLVAQQAHPTYDHFLPLLYTLGLAGTGADITTFCEGFQWPGISMRSLVLA